MPYSDSIRVETATFTQVASLIDGLLVAVNFVTSSASVSSTATSATDYTGMTTTVTVPSAGRVDIDGYITVSHGTISTPVEVLLTDGANTQIGVSSFFTSQSANTSGRDTAIPVTAAIAPSAGSYTVKIRWLTTTGTMYSIRAALKVKVFQST